MLYMRIFLSCGAYGEYESTVSSSGGQQGQQAISVDVPVTLAAYGTPRSVFAMFMLGWKIYIAGN